MQVFEYLYGEYGEYSSVFRSPPLIMRKMIFIYAIFIVSFVVDTLHMCVYILRVYSVHYVM